MRRTRRILHFAAALFAATALVSPATAGKADNSVRFSTVDTPPSIDPYFNNVRIGVILADQIWDTLIYRDPETGTFKGNLATAWRWIDDRTLVLDLRQGVRFHNGAPFTADDVVHTLNFVSNPANKAVYFSIVRWIDHVEKLDAFKVRIVTRQRFPAAIAYLAAASVVIHPHEYYGKVGPRGMNERPVGTGPFRVAEHILGKSVRLERNPDYFQDGPKSRPKLDTVEVRFIPDAQTRVAEAVAGGLDLIMYVARDQADQLRVIPTLHIMPGETMRYSFLAMNTMAGTPSPPLRDIRVRKAIMHAIDRVTMVRYLAGEGARVLHADCYPTQFGCVDAGVPQYAYNPDEARRLLTEAGYPQGFDIDIYAYLNRNETEAVIGYLRAVGVRANLRFLQAAAMTSAMTSGRAPLVHFTWGSGSIGDVSASTSMFHDFSAFDLSRDGDVRDLLARGDSEMDPEARKTAYARALSLIAERAYVLPLYSVPIYYAAAKDLAFRPSPDEIPRFYEMSWK